jgi:hypothetical protein
VFSDRNLASSACAASQSTLNRSTLTFTGMDDATTVQQLLDQISSGQMALITAAGVNVTNALWSVVYAPLSQTPNPAPDVKSSLMSMGLIAGLAAVAVVALGVAGALFVRFARAPPASEVKDDAQSGVERESSFFREFVPEEDSAPPSRTRKPRQRGSVFQHSHPMAAGKRGPIFQRTTPQQQCARLPA